MIIENLSKIFNALTLILIFCLTNIFIIFRDNALDPNYLKIKKFEDSYSKRFVEKFFSNSITEMKKFRELTIIIKITLYIIFINVIYKL